MLPAAGIFILDGLILPLTFYLILRKSRYMKNIPFSTYLRLYIIGVVIFPILLPRKHLEYWLTTQSPSFLFVLLVVQMVNNIFEESGKAITLYAGAGKKGISTYSAALLLGLFSGMSYGIGEAFTLSVIGMKPVLNKVFGINLTLLFITWGWVLERFYSILIHTVMGGLVGVSLYFFKKSGYLKAFLLFVTALLYHEFVDGLIIYANFHQTSRFSSFVMNHMYDAILPILVLLGTAGILILFRKKEVRL